MKTMKTGRCALIARAIARLELGTPAFADGHQFLESIHFLIPGGGRDGTACGMGCALRTAGHAGSASN